VGLKTKFPEQSSNHTTFFDPDLLSITCAAVCETVILDASHSFKLSGKASTPHIGAGTLSFSLSFDLTQTVGFLYFLFPRSSPHQQVASFPTANRVLS